MIVTNRLTTTVSVVSAVVTRYAHIRTIHQQFKIIRTTRASRYSPVRYLGYSSYHVTSSSVATCACPSDSMLNRGVCEKSKRMAMTELPVENCQTTDCRSHQSGCEIPIDLSENTIEACDDSVIIIEEFANVDTTMGAKGTKASMSKSKYKRVRQWKPAVTATQPINPDVDFVLRILSYNILAQILLETHFYLYRKHDNAALSWEKRKVLLQQEIFRAKANVICLQEMQLDHLTDFVAVFEAAGYSYLYKKRTNDKEDGLLLLYRADQLKLVDHAKVELYQPEVDILNRDNVAIVAKFSLVDNPETHIVISTTHLLYNPRRNDIRLAQTQMLFAELERIAFIKSTKDGPRYHPIILSGDFNLQPHSGVYRFITEGTFEYHDKGRSLEPETMTRVIGYPLIPPSLLVTDNCQHLDLLAKRSKNVGGDAKMVDNMDENKQRLSLRRESSKVADSQNKDEVVANSDKCQKPKIVEGQQVKFSAGTLTHPFKLHSLYRHSNVHGEPEATTHQEKWITVDYIFFSGVEPVDRYNLPTVSQCKLLPTIPNNIVGSDHLCLGASFKLKKLKKKASR